MQRLGDRVHVVADEQHRPALAHDVAHLPEALLLERRVADGEHLVDDQDLRLQVRRHRERQPHVHAAELYRFTGVSRNFSTSLNATISSNFALISARLIPRIAPLRKMFSRPVSSG